MSWPWHLAPKDPYHLARHGRRYRLRRALRAFRRPRTEPDSPPDVHALLSRQAGHIDDAPDWLDAFLGEPELDNLVTRHVASDLSSEQSARIRQVLQTGAPRQALFNLLLSPRFIPPDVRLEAIRSAIRQDADPYLRIAAIVGMQNPDAVEIPAGDWPAIRDELVATLYDPRESIRNRATVTLAGRIQRSDAAAVLRAATRAELGGTEIGNLTGALANVGADHAALALIPLLLERGARNPELRAWLEAWDRGGARPPGPLPLAFGLPILAYIPNLDG